MDTGCFLANQEEGLLPSVTPYSSESMRPVSQRAGCACVFDQRGGREMTVRRPPNVRFHDVPTGYTTSMIVRSPTDYFLKGDR